MLRFPGLDIATTSVDRILTWGSANSLWIFPMATSCCGIEFMATAASRVDIDRMGSIPRGTPRHCDVMVVAGTITVKMAPRVKRLWDQIPEPKWCVAMGSCAISGDFYRDIYSVIPGIDVAIPVDVYIPGCPPNPETLMAGMMRLQEKVELRRAGKPVPKDDRPTTLERTIIPSIGRFEDRMKTNLADPISELQLESARKLLVRGLRPIEPAPVEAPAASPEPTEIKS
ncbi:MAG: NADH-quinone oxidoreductase subunit NuoB [Deltaproteobacteria bacterium]|nr:NADH-quinone oxidoreductase subunit NuoB [Deltaproteobacteria bacterium]